MRKRTSDKDKKEDKNQKENRAEQPPKTSHTEREQEPAAAPPPPGGDRTLARRPRRRRSASEKATPVPVEVGPTPPASLQKAPPREQDAVSLAADPSEGEVVEKHAKPVSEKKKPRSRSRKNTGNENTSSKKGVGADIPTAEDGSLGGLGGLGGAHDLLE